MKITTVSMNQISRQIEEEARSLIKLKIEELRLKAVDELNREFVRLALKAERLFNINQIVSTSPHEVDIRVSVALLGISE